MWACGLHSSDRTESDSKLLWTAFRLNTRKLAEPLPWRALLHEVRSLKCAVAQNYVHLNVVVWPCDGVTVWRCDGVTVWRCDGVTVWRYITVKLWWSNDLTVWLFDGVIVWRDCNDIMVWRTHATIWWHDVTRRCDVTAQKAAILIPLWEHKIS
jgi:hypothetical protein